MTKGNRGGERFTARYAWENFYEFTGTKLEQFPLPHALPLEFGRELDALAHQLAAVSRRRSVHLGSADAGTTGRSTGRA